MMYGASRRFGSDLVLAATILLIGACSADPAGSPEPSTPVRGEPPPVRVVNLRCEYVSDPLGIDVPRPRLSWVLGSGTRGQRQTAYRVLVASTPELLAEDRGDLWDGGKVRSDASTHVEYEGALLVSRQDCHWKVRVWDKDGRASAWSPPAAWTMGLLHPEDWRAKWITTEGLDPSLLPAPRRLKVLEAVYATLDGSVSVDVTGRVAELVENGRLSVPVRPDLLGGDPAVGIVKELRITAELDGNRHEFSARDFETVEIPESPGPDARNAPYLRRTFMLDAAPNSATAYINVRGYCELFVNGTKVGDDVLSPAVTDPGKYLYYRTHDIGPLLRPGRNCVGLWVGHGWCRSPGWEDTGPLVRAQFEISAGEEQVILGTDRGWTCRPSSHRRLGDWKWNGMGGERIDARRAIPGWSTAGCPEDGWIPVREVPDPPGEVRAQPCPPNRVGAVVPLVSCTPLGPGIWELDFGVNLTGWLRLRLPRMDPGQKVTLRYADKRYQTPEGDVTPAGKIEVRSPWTVDTEQGPVCYQTFNQVDEFFSAGKDGEQFSSKFNYHGFRYVIVEGLVAAPAPGNAEALLIETDLAPAGSFACSNDLFNRIHEVNLWTLRCLDLGGYVVDCPHRERLGYGDGQVGFESLAMSRDAAAFYAKWAVDWREAQDPETGEIPYNAPYLLGSGGGPGWGGAGCVLPWKLYLHYGDRRLLERAREPIRRYLEFLDSKSEDDILRHYGHEKWGSLGDWVAPGRGMDSENWPSRTANELFNNCYRIYLWNILAQASEALGEENEARQCRDRISELQPRVHAAFFDPAKQVYVLDEQTYQVMPLMTGVVPLSLRETMVQKLEDGILVKRDGHLDTGMLGTKFLLEYLGATNRHDLLHTIFGQTTYPGWGYMLSQGATTFWEQWNGFWSQIHSCFTSPSGWFYQGLAGIRPDAARPGFKHVIIRPAIVGDLTWVEAHHDSIHGRIVSNWRREDGRLTMDVTIPANTTATVFVPAVDVASVTESGAAVHTAEAVRFLRMQDGAAVFSVGSGSYRFVSR